MANAASLSLPLADMAEPPPAIEIVDADGRERRKVVDQLHTLTDGSRLLPRSNRQSAPGPRILSCIWAMWRQQCQMILRIHPFLR
ncbi:hypothetical protein RA27_00625 [Ruegeria sp. ANG-R]|nr:hypothetical protein RA27_00625 [Ruegeria sp. ANG-R]